MFDFIKNHAIENVWCTPDQDTQLIIEPTRITPPNGAMNSYNVLQKKINLPDSKSYWNLYRIGQLHPLLLGLTTKVDKWVSFAEACNTKNMICDIYVNSGVQLPRFDTFYMYSNNRDLIVAVKNNKQIPFNFTTDKIFIRVYSNEYFNTIESDAIVDKVYVSGKKILLEQDVIDIQIEVSNLHSLNGHLYSFVNGFKVNDINLATAKVGDIVEYVYDSSILKIVDFTVKSLNTFESTLDSKIKYLLHYIGSDDNIYFYDDIDIFIIDNKGLAVDRGIYFHKNNKDTVRMLTHRDYSIPVAYVLGYVETLQKAITTVRFIDPEDLVIRLHIRKSGYNRLIVNESNRIKELYKMNDEDIQRAMFGIDSTIVNWRAAELEASDYTKIMQSKYQDITNTMVQDAYGYNSMSKIIGDTPSKTYLKSGKYIADVPYGLQNSVTAYEYSNDGVLLTYNPYSSGSVYTAENINTRMVEFISGHGSELLSDVFGITDVPVPANNEYRVYVCTILNGVPNNIWKDVTGTDSYFIQNGKIKWVDHSFDHYLRVSNSNNFLCYDLNLQANLGSLSFSLNCKENRQGIINEYIMQLPMGELDIFLNGKSLIPNLDYFVDFPEVVIINKEYLVNPLTQVQKIHVRFTGFCNSKLEFTKCTDIGFIKYGFLSNNNKFDIRDDKVLRIVVDGKLHHRDDVKFSEDNSGASIINTINGKPYCIRDIVVPLNGLTSESTYSLREKSIVTDISISDYLTLKVPQPPRPEFTVIESRYQVFSPFICKLIYDLNIGVLNDPRILSNFSDSVVSDICRPYERLLDFDPITEECRLDNNFVIIHPHNLFSVIELDFFSYRFIERVVKLYAKGLVTISGFLTVKPIVNP